jgi:hypothetical protein
VKIGDTEERRWKSATLYDTEDRRCVKIGDGDEPFFGV